MNIEVNTYEMVLFNSRSWHKHVTIEDVNEYQLKMEVAIASDRRRPEERLIAIRRNKK